MARKGLPASIIKKYGVTKKAWQVYRGGRKSKKRSNPSRKGKTRRRSYSMARRRRKRRSRKMSIPLAPIGGLIAGMAVPAQLLMRGDIQNAVNVLVENYTGVAGATTSPHFDADKLKNGLVPLVAGLLVHKFVGGAPLNLNRTLAAAGVPLLRI